MNRALFPTLRGANAAIALAMLFLPACLMMPPAGSGAAPSSGPSANAPESGGAPGGGPATGGGAHAAAAPAAPSGPQLDSLTLHNDCKKTVKLFVGEKPKFGSGTTTSIGSNTTQSYTLGVGKMIWIVDESDSGLSAYTGQVGSHRIRISASCGSFVPD